MVDISDSVVRAYSRIASDGPVGLSGNDRVALAERWGYSATDAQAAPQSANLGTSCGAPITPAQFRAGEVVVDLGSGGGFDALLAARAVAPTGRVIGVDFSAQMINRARANARLAGHENVEFRLGDLEALPVDSESVDCVISNCVINLVKDKRRVFQEVARVLKPGGRFVASDTVVLQKLPCWAKSSLQLHACCVSGALHGKDEYVRHLAESGLVDPEILSEQDVTDLFIGAETWEEARPASDKSPIPQAGLVGSITVRAEKPPRMRPEPGSADGAALPLLIMLGLSPGVIAEAERLGAEVAFFGPANGRPPRRGRLYEVDLASTADLMAKVKEVAAGRRVAGVLTLDGYFVQAAAQLAAALDVPSPVSKDFIPAADNKLRARRLLADAGIPGPQFASLRTTDDLAAKTAGLTWPLVAKPLNDSNSRLVRLCHNEPELEEAAQAILESEHNLVQQLLAKEVLVEEYIDGSEYSAEVIVEGGEVSTLAICEKRVGPPPYFIETGHMIPAQLTDVVYEKIRTVAEAAVLAVGACQTVCHVELRLRSEEAFVIEVNLRRAGGKLPELILATTGWDLEAAAVALALGRSPEPLATPRATVGIYECITVDQPCHIFYEQRAIKLPPSKCPPFVELDFAPGTLAYPVNDPRGKILGRILAYGATKSEALGTIKKIQSELRLKTQPAGVDVEPTCGVPSCWSSGCC